MKGQTGLEYLVIIAVILIVAGIVTFLVSGSLGGQKESVQFQTCRDAATACKIAHIANASAECPACDTACKDPTTGKDIIGQDSSGKDIAISCCKAGQPEKIYLGQTQACTYTTAGVPPVCKFSANTSDGAEANESGYIKIKYNASESYARNPDGTPSNRQLTYSWSFGPSADPSSSTAKEQTVTFSEITGTSCKNVEANLTVKDGNLESKCSKTITVCPKGYSSGFAGKAPQVVSHNPPDKVNDNVRITIPIWIKFSTPMDTSETNKAIKIYKVVGGAQGVEQELTKTLRWDEENTKVYIEDIDNGKGLEGNMDYKIVITTQAKSEDEYNLAADYSFGLRTGCVIKYGKCSDCINNFDEIFQGSVLKPGCVLVMYDDGILSYTNQHAEASNWAGNTNWYRWSADNVGVVCNDHVIYFRWQIEFSGKKDIEFVSCRFYYKWPGLETTEEENKRYEMEAARIYIHDSFNISFLNTTWIYSHDSDSSPDNPEVGQAPFLTVNNSDSILFNDLRVVVYQSSNDYHLWCTPLVYLKDISMSVNGIGSYFNITHTYSDTKIDTSKGGAAIVAENLHKVSLFLYDSSTILYTDSYSESGETDALVRVTNFGSSVMGFDLHPSSIINTRAVYLKDGRDTTIARLSVRTDSITDGDGDTTMFVIKNSKNLIVNNISVSSTSLSGDVYGLSLHNVSFSKFENINISVISNALNIEDNSYNLSFNNIERLSSNGNKGVYINLPSGVGQGQGEINFSGDGPDYSIKGRIAAQINLSGQDPKDFIAVNFENLTLENSAKNLSTIDIHANQGQVTTRFKNITFIREAEDWSGDDSPHILYGNGTSIWLSFTGSIQFGEAEGVYGKKVVREAILKLNTDSSTIRFENANVTINGFFLDWTGDSDFIRHNGGSSGAGISFLVENSTINAGYYPKHLLTTNYLSGLELHNSTIKATLMQDYVFNISGISINAKKQEYKPKNLYNTMYAVDRGDLSNCFIALKNSSIIGQKVIHFDGSYPDEWYRYMCLGRYSSICYDDTGDPSTPLIKIDCTNCGTYLRILMATCSGLYTNALTYYGKELINSSSGTCILRTKTTTTPVLLGRSFNYTNKRLHISTSSAICPHVASYQDCDGWYCELDNASIPAQKVEDYGGSCPPDWSKDKYFKGYCN
ncbi:MAG: Ig-like domain-containing protein [archaeon]